MPSMAKVREQMAAQAPSIGTGQPGPPSKLVAQSCAAALGGAHPAYDADAVLAQRRRDGSEASWFVYAGSNRAGSMSSADVGTTLGTALSALKSDGCPQAWACITTYLGEVVVVRPSF